MRIEKSYQLSVIRKWVKNIIGIINYISELNIFFGNITGGYFLRKDILNFGEIGSMITVIRMELR